MDTHTTDRILDEILAGLRARRQMRMHSSSKGDKDATSKGSSSNTTSSTTNTTTTTTTAANPDHNRGSSNAVENDSKGEAEVEEEEEEEDDDSSDLVEDLFLKLKILQGTLRSGGRKDDAVENFVEITWTGTESYYHNCDFSFFARANVFNQSINRTHRSTYLAMRGCDGRYCTEFLITSTTTTTMCMVPFYSSIGLRY